MQTKKIGIKFLVALLVMLLLASNAFAEKQVGLIFNGQEFDADITLKDGLTYIPAKTLSRIPGLEIGDEQIVPIRKLFEDQDGIVSWDHDNWQVIVSWRERAGDYTADELVVEHTKRLKEVNTYKMEGSHFIETEGFLELPGISNMPEIKIFTEGIFQYEPMAMYMKQTMEIPLDELEEVGLGKGIVTEMVWFDNAIYRKDPIIDRWIVQDLTEVEETFDINDLMQITPQQSMEMMRKAGVLNVFGDDIEKNGKEYYTIKNYIDADSFKTLMEEILGNFDLTALIKATSAQPGISEQEIEDFEIQFEQIFEILTKNTEIKYYIDTLIDKETLMPDYMNYDLNIRMNLKQLFDEFGAMNEIEKETKHKKFEGQEGSKEQEKVEEEKGFDVSEIPLEIEFKIKGEFRLYDYGIKLELPDLSDSISQEEYVQQLMNQIEQIEQIEEMENFVEPESE